MSEPKFEAWRRSMDILSRALDILRTPGWPRRIFIVAVLFGIMFIPYSIHVVGDFELVSLQPTETRMLTSGVIRDVKVHAGERVARDQVVVEVRDGEHVLAQSAGVVVTPEHELQRLVGQTVSAGAALFEIVDPAALVARVRVPENEAGDIQRGQPVLLRTYQNPTESIGSVVESIEPRVEKNGERATSVAVVVRVAGEGRELRLNTTGKAKIECGSSFLGHAIYRRLLRSSFVQLWSWY